MNLKRTAKGLEYQVFTKVDKKWDDYDQMVGKSQLKRFKKCFMDKNNIIIEEEDDLKDILENERL
jgi:hypothetical protein